MATLTLATLRARVATRAAVTIGASERHTPATIDAYINEAIEEYHLELTECGHPQRVTQATASTSTSSTLSNGFPAYSYVSLPADFMALVGAWLVIDNESSVQLLPFAEGDIERFGHQSQPERYRLAEDATGGKILRLLPYADDVYTIAVTYIPLPTELSNDAESITLFPGTAEFVICDAALRVLEDDGVPEGAQFQAILRRKEAAKATLYKYASLGNRAGPLVIDAPAMTRNPARLPDYLR